MLSVKQQAARNREGVRRWYGENRDEYNAARRKRYAESKPAREKAQKRAAEYRAEGKKPIKRKLTRELNGKTVEVFSTGQVAAMMGHTPQMIRNWERECLIPMSVFPDVHRLYTKRQARMIVTLSNTVKRNGGSLDSVPVWKYSRKMRASW